ncbi:anion permease [Virgibacillus sp. AGTR]|uniref:SLC13 family permease n=1 Tax=Virgibacillus sp. AGTR TaxID=2812055 RepID=UPI001D161E75|nr:SLC13 family permease [Virgibacillus sp. AGTR]MCC2252509.1 anion permease [Virgibacillus sp. AGTR]
MSKEMVGPFKSSKWTVFDARLSKKSIWMISLHFLFFMATMLIGELDYSARVSLFAFLSAMTFWVMTSLSAGFVAIMVIIGIVLFRAAEATLLYESFAQEVVWLMIGAFIIGEAVKQSGLGDRLIYYLLRKSRQKHTLLLFLTNLLLVSAFFIPSTSGRAALTKPIISELGQRFHTNEERGFLALLAPVVILMSTSATLIGAGSHLIGVGLLENTTDQSISYIQWFIWAVPFTIAITFITFFIMKWFIWPSHSLTEVGKSISINGHQMKPTTMTTKEKQTLRLIGLLLLAWLTEHVHGYDIGFITMAGALLFMLPRTGVISWKEGINAISWQLIMFVAAATALGKTLVDTGVVGWIEGGLLDVLNVFDHIPNWLFMIIMLVIAVTSHLYVHSHTTRAIIFIPSIIVFSESIGLNTAAVVFLSLLGMNYCLTFPVSSKAILLFYEAGDMTIDAKQLLQLSTILMPVYILVMIVFYFTYWQWTGLQL